jgi:hypothetical protein
MGLFSSIMGKMFDQQDAKNKLGGLKDKLGSESDPMKRLEISRELEKAQGYKPGNEILNKSFGDLAMEGAKEHFMGKAGNLGFGADGFSMKTAMEAQKGRAESALPAVMQFDPVKINPVTATAPGTQPMMPQVPTMGGVGPSPAMQQIQAAQRQYAMYGMPQQYQAPGLLSGPSLPTTGALNVPAGYTSPKDRLLGMYG